jgi:hypothetical protein
MLWNSNSVDQQLRPHPGVDAPESAHPGGQRRQASAKSGGVAEGTLDLPSGLVELLTVIMVEQLDAVQEKEKTAM